MLTEQDLIEFEREVAEAFKAGKIRSPVHLSGGNEDQLVDIFREIDRDDWIFSTWRSHYHALLHGIPRDIVMQAIMMGRSMNLNFPAYCFLSSAIMGGILPIACGVAAGGKKTWCFVGDMCASTGAFHDALRFAEGHDLPITFVIEDNGLSTNTPTHETWGQGSRCKTRCYEYQRTYPHVGLDQFVQF